MQTINQVGFGWKAVERILNAAIRGVNARTPIPGNLILIDEAAANGVVISADANAISAMIADAVAAAKASANAKAASEGGAGGGGGGGGGTGGSVTNWPNDASGTGEGAGWNGPDVIPAAPGSPADIVPMQYDLPDDITGYLIYTIAPCYDPAGCVCHTDVIMRDGSGAGQGGGSCAGWTGPFWYQVLYYHQNGSLSTGPMSPPFSMPAAGGTIVLGGHSVYLPPSNP